MKKFACLLLLLLVQTAVVAQSTEEQQVATAVENMRKAVISADQTALEQLTAEALSYGHSSGTIEDKAAFVKALSSGASVFKTFDISEQTIVISGDNAIVRHKLSARVVDKGKPADVRLGVLLVWQKQAGDWKLLARQAFKL